MQLLKSPLVFALGDDWQAVLDGLARRRGLPSTSDPAKLAPLVRKLSDAYNGPSAAPVRDEDALAARLGFSFARDVPKGGGAVRELVATGALSMPRGRPLRVLDVGAGLGASSRGVARALAACGLKGEMAVDALDSDSGALELSRALHSARPTEGGVSIAWTTLNAPVHTKLPVTGPYDLVLAGQVLSELDRDAPDDERLRRHASLVTSLAQLLRDDGSLVVIEPGLRERARHLHAVRDAVLAASKLGVFAPCMHDASCPALVDPDAWCHEDLEVDLPPWLVPVARAAGLRWQGLTFSYVAFRRDGRSQATPRRGGAARAELFRIVSSPVVSKGKRELFACGRFGGDRTVARLKVMRLDRHRLVGPDPWERAARGDVLSLAPPPSLERPRVDLGTIVETVTPKAATVPLRGLYAIVDVASVASRGLDVVAVAEALLLARPAALQVRAKDLTRDALFALLTRLGPLARLANVPLVANDDAESAARAGCAYVHVGQGDMSVEQVRAFAPALSVGVSTHTMQQLDAALEARPEYVAFGPVFPTSSKATPEPCVGIEGLRMAAMKARAARVPLVAIGGISQERAGEVSRWADASAVIGALLPSVGSEDPYAEVTARATALKAALEADPLP